MITCMKSRPFIVACLLLTLTSLFWSGNFVLARAMHAALPPMALSFGRWLIAFVLLAPFALPRAWRDRRLLWEQRGRLLLLAALGVAGFNSLVYTGVQFTTATNAVLLNSFIPILTVAFGALFFRQGLHGRQVAGMARGEHGQVARQGRVFSLAEGGPAGVHGEDVAGQHMPPAQAGARRQKSFSSL